MGLGLRMAWDYGECGSGAERGVRVGMVPGGARVGGVLDGRGSIGGMPRSLTGIKKEFPTPVPKPWSCHSGGVSGDDCR